MKDLVILHLSDLHFNKNDYGFKKIKNYFLNDIKEFIQRISAEPDLIIFSGDLVQKPNTDEHFLDISVFQEAYRDFFEELLTATELSKDKLIFTPGNHDLNRGIRQKDKRGLESYKNQDQIDILIEEILSEKEDLLHFQQYNTFIDSLKYANIVHKNKLFRIYSIECGKVKIGIACFNSCLFSFESDISSYGSQCVGESQIKESMRYLSGFDIIVANLHYSSTWLMQFEQHRLRRLLLESFNIVFFGHDHIENTEMITYKDDNCLMVCAPSIYDGTRKIHGYSILKYSFSETKMSICVREYSDKDNSFTTHSANGGLFNSEIDVDITKKSKSKINQQITIDSLKDIFFESSKKELLFNIAKNESKNIYDIFIEPDIYSESEYHSTENEIKQKTKISISELLSSGDNYLIHGIGTSGKSTLLKYLAHEYMNLRAPSIRIPITIDVGSFNFDKIASFETEIKEYFRINSKSKNLPNSRFDEFCRAGDFVFLIDNIGEKHYGMLEDIMLDTRFSKNRFIFTTTEIIFESINQNIDKKTIKLNYCRYYYIHSFKREKARQFLTVWGSEANTIMDDIYQHIANLNIPSTPLTYTLIAYIYEHKLAMKVTNDSYLLEIFIENLLERFDISKNLLGTINYDLKIDYLISIAEYMLSIDNYTIDYCDIVTITSEYFKKINRKNDNATHLISYFVGKGIFVQYQNSQIAFKFRAFFEYLIAKKMTKDVVFKNKILSKEEYFKYQNEIIYYTGLSKDDVKVLEFFDEVFNDDDLRNFADNVDTTVNLQSIYVPDLKIDGDFTLDAPDIKKQDELLDRDEKKVMQQQVERVNSVSIERKFFELTHVLAKSLRNLELVKDSNLKKKLFNTVMHNYEVLFYAINADIQNLESTLLGNDRFKDAELNKVVFLLRIVSTQGLLFMLGKNLGTSSLDLLIEGYKEEFANNKIAILSIISIYLTLNFSKAKKIIADTIKSDFKNERFMLMVVFFKLYSAVKIGDIKNTNQAKELLVQIIAELSPNKKATLHYSKDNIIKQIENTLKKD